MRFEVEISGKLIDIILENARAGFPQEKILLLRGKTKKGVIKITDVVIPPLATSGDGFSAFPASMLPMDFSIKGSVHSHPSGNLTPSIEDLNHFFGRVMMIVAHPFRRENVAVFNDAGENIGIRLVE
jgi:proteasome lid subunit RPN8/RPN11